MPLLAAVSLVSAAAIAYEILLTRLFAIALWHHFVYMIISLALLGYGASGTFLVLRQASPVATIRRELCSACRSRSALRQSDAMRWRHACRSTRSR